MKLGFLQLHITADVADNKRRLAEGIIDLAHRGAELIAGIAQYALFLSSRRCG